MVQTNPSPLWKSHLRTLARLAGVVLTGGLIAGAHAEVRVQGSAAALQVDARQAKVAEVLSALAGLKVRVRTSIALDRMVDGAYGGTLGHVLRRLLDGYDFVMAKTDDLTEVVVVGAGGEATVAVQRARSASK
jgi:hypothetical protein